MPTKRIKLIAESWFNYYWGKSDGDNVKLHTVIFDFDDTITKTFQIQIDCWCKILEDALGDNTLKIPIAAISNKVIKDNNVNKKEIEKIFFEKQKADDILNEIFGTSNLGLKEIIQKTRYNLRKEAFENLRQSLLFENVENSILTLSNKYHLSIISSTDGDLIRNYLKKVKINDKDGIRTLDTYFEYIIGKNDSLITFSPLTTKANRLISFAQIIGIPYNRLVYIGDSNEDHEACKQTNIQFAEARLNQQVLKETIGKTSLIKDLFDVKHFSNWNQLATLLNDMK